MSAVRRIVSTLFVAAALAFLFLAVARDWERLRTYTWRVDVPGLLASLALLLVVFTLGVYTWGHAVRCLPGPAVPLRALLRIWFLSNLARYIPGKVWQLVGAAQLARGAGLSAARLVTSLLVSMGFTLAAGVVVALATLPELPGMGAGVRWWATGSAVLAALVATHPAFLKRALTLVPRRLHGSLLAWQGRWRDSALLLGLATAGWIGYGAAFHMFAEAITDVPPGSWAALTGANAAGFVAGYLVFIAPAGLGARELSMAALLAPVFAVPGLAAVVALASRLWVVAAEVVGAGVVALVLPGGAINREEREAREGNG